MTDETEEVVDTVVEAVRRDLLERSKFGIRKYGATLCRADLGLRDWLQHAYEECLDQANYLKCSIQLIDARYHVIDLKGRTFDRLTVMERAPRPSRKMAKGYAKQAWWRCECACGKVLPRALTSEDLRKGKVKSCGCLRSEMSSKSLKVLHSKRKENNIFKISA